VSEADLKSMGTVADRAAGPLAPPTPPPEPPQHQKPAPQPEPPPPEPRAPEPQAQPKAEPPPQQTAALTAEPPPPSAPQEQAKAASPDKPAMLPDPAVEQLLKIPTQAALPHTLDPPKPPEPAKPATPAKPEQARRAQPKQSQVRTSSLDLSLPPSFYAAPFGGGGVGVHRPAGVTRSGENDTFSRGVIAALQRSMPQLRETLGRVTVRIILDKDGSLVKTEVIRPSSVAGLDQSVVFSTRQASFPFPPRNANSADLTFLVTYIYR
jgi:protein TonB